MNHKLSRFHRQKGLVVFALLFPLVASAGEEMVANAIAAKNFELAFATARADVDAGKASDYEKLVLAQLYLKGSGTPKNPAAASKILQAPARAGVLDAQFFLAGSLMAEARNGWQDQEGRVIPERFQALAGRTLAERSLERQSSEWMYRAAQAGHALATEAIGSEVGNSITGLDTAQRAKWLRAANKENWALAQELGESWSSLVLRREVLQNDQVAAAFQAQAVKAACLDENIKLVKTAVSQPLQGAEYLRLELSPAVNYKLIRGAWQETWTGRACGQDFPVQIDFVADGMGSATYRLK